MRLLPSCLLILFCSSLFSISAMAQLPFVPGLDTERLAVPNAAAPMYQETGEQYRVYEFPGTGEPIPYRLFVPTNWTLGTPAMPVLITLRAGPSINNNHRGDNDLVLEAARRGYIVISPLGYRGYQQPYYGSPYPINRPDGPSEPGAGWTEEEDERAELDVLNVLNIVATEYNIDQNRIFIHGQNPSASAAFNFAAKYPDLFAGVLASAGPIVTDNYPFENLVDKVAVLLIHGDQDTRNTALASQAVANELQSHGVEAKFSSVEGGEHLTAYLDFAKEIFDFFDTH